MKIEDKISKILFKYIKKQESILIAYSGGLDSSVLLHELFIFKKKQLIKNIRAIHINHLFSSHSISWENHCKKVCNTYKIPLIIKHIDKKIKKKSNTEEKLRIQRFKIIKKEILKKEILITAHHLNDQCENFILSVKRGSGITGISGMYEYKKFFSNKIIRPLIYTKKKNIYQFAIKNNISWIEDKSNKNNYYDRNFIRNVIFPKLEKKWPNFIKTCSRTIKICQENEKIINLLSNKIFKKCLNIDNSLNIDVLKKQPRELCSIILRKWIKIKKEKFPSYTSINRIYKEIIYNNKNYKNIVFINKKKIMRYKNKIDIFPVFPNIKKKIIIWNTPFNSLKLPYHLGYIEKNISGNRILKPKKNEIVSIRFQCSKKIWILGEKKEKKIKKIFQKLNIPAWQRNCIPFLFYNEKFISALGVFTVKNKIKLNNKKFWTISWIKKIVQK
ncbi:tRNA lysidine(34) synthetase TilS [Buchnera aphidicola (Kurisakia onigurumii)]|uniref:tRNA lysidine(34) synthetase TilS n=1 Tax=Buchnera aphidicola TaxID=9 RepID=UPI0031B70CE5